MAFLPCPSVKWYQVRASCAAGFFSAFFSRVSSSIFFAPTKSASISIPCSAAGSRPTGPNSLVRPPTQSHMGKRANHFSLTAI